MQGKQGRFPRGGAPGGVLQSEKWVPDYELRRLGRGQCDQRQPGILSRAVLLLGDSEQCLEIVLVVPGSGAVGIRWVEVRIAAQTQHPVVPRTPHKE